VQNTPGAGFSLEFQAVDNNDLFESFDFDSFLHTGDGDLGGVDSLNFGGDGVEAA
jgi:hypothetical protein